MDDQAARERSINQGAALAEALVPALRAATDKAEEPLLFWAGFLSNISGCMVANVGGEATIGPIANMEDLAKKFIRGQSH
jgi:hypothetical protein